MKRVFTIVALTALTALGVAQNPSGQTNNSTASPQVPSSGQAQSATPPTQQSGPAGGSQTPAGGTPAAAPAHSKGAPQAKTQEEFKAYQDVVAITDAVKMEAAADEFAQKFPNSELRTVLYNQLLNTYRNGGATDRAIAVGRKSLAIDATDPVPNVLVALALAQTTRDTDLDRDDRLNESARDAQRAIENIDTGMAIPPSTPPEKVQAAKNSILAMAYETLGTVSMGKKDFPAAENAFRKGLEVNTKEPDGVLYLRLAIALDNQKKYPEAMQATESALKYVQAGSEAQNLANQEKSRLQKLVGSAPNAPQTPAPTAQ